MKRSCSVPECDKLSRVHNMCDRHYRLLQRNGSPYLQPLLNLIGVRFGQLTVVAQAPTRKGKRRWTCLCDCGGSSVVSTGALRSGMNKSCGCRKYDGLRRRSVVNRKHRLKKIKAYSTWSSMLTRCYNKKRESYKWYGERGITVCERWHDFRNFLADMGQPPSAKHMLDRFPNNDGNYEPGNCRWATAKEQARNTRTNKLVEIDGITRSFADWCEALGLNYMITYNVMRTKGGAPRAFNNPTARILK